MNRLLEFLSKQEWGNAKPLKQIEFLAPDIVIIAMIFIYCKHITFYCQATSTAINEIVLLFLMLGF